MDRHEFLATLKQSGDTGVLVETCRRHLLHGTPHVFSGREDSFFDFRRRIADKFAAMPVLSIKKAGFGAGSLERNGKPNVLAIYQGKTSKKLLK